MTHCIDVYCVLYFIIIVLSYVFLLVLLPLYSVYFASHTSIVVHSALSLYLYGKSSSKHNEQSRCRFIRCPPLNRRFVSEGLYRPRPPRFVVVAACCLESLRSLWAGGVVAYRSHITACGSRALDASSVPTRILPFLDV